MNVRINAAGYDDKVFARDMLLKGKEIEKKAIEMEASILEIVNSKIEV